MELAAYKYNRSNKLQIRDGHELIHIIQQNEPDRKYEIILDIGCGSGNITHLIGKTFDAKIYGVDIDPEMISFAKEHHPNDRITYLCQDFGQDWQQLSPEMRSLEGQVSLIFTNHCLHWIPNKENVVKNLKRLLSKNGRIYANIYWITDLYPELSPEEKAVHEREFMKVPPKEEQRDVWVDLFHKQGFDLLKEQFFFKDIIFERDVFDEHILPLGVTIRRVYFSKKEPDDFDNKVKDLSQRAINKCKQFVDEKSGQKMIEFKYGYFHFILKPTN